MTSGDGGPGRPGRFPPRAKWRERRRGLKPERKLVLGVLAGGAPAVAATIALLAVSELPAAGAWSVGVAVVAAWLAAAAGVRNTAAFRLRTLSNLLAGLREGDYSFRVRGGRRDDAFGELVVELNLLAQTLREERFGDVESTALLGKVMAEIDVAVLAFDAERRLRLANPSALRLLGGDGAAMLGRSADELALSDLLTGPPARTVTLPLAAATNRWELRRGTFRQGGWPHTLLVLSNVSRALRAEELAAWQRLIRVLGHELNNSLAPIKSIAGSAERIIASDPLPPDWREDVGGGLRVIAGRAESLARLMGAYATLARLPRPVLGDVDVETWVRRAAGLETRLPVAVEAGPPARLRADGDQLDQLLINLVKNAVDAALETSGGVRVSWAVGGGEVEVRVDDDGPGLTNPANVFVPFFTTKPGGTGIGLALGRQIVEAHGGTLTLANRPAGPGCRATVRLPAAP